MPDDSESEPDGNQNQIGTGSGLESNQNQVGTVSESDLRRLFPEYFTDEWYDVKSQVNDSTQALPHARLVHAQHFDLVADDNMTEGTTMPRDKRPLANGTSSDVHARFAKDDERQLLSDIAGLEIFTIPDDDEHVRTVLDLNFKISEVERRALERVASVLDRFERMIKDRVAICVRSELVPAEMKVELLMQAVSMSGVNDSVRKMMAILGNDEKIEAMLGKEMMRAMRILKNESHEVDADVTFKLGLDTFREHSD